VERAAELIGVSPTTLSYWRNGKQTPAARAQRSLLAFFEVDYWAARLNPVRRAPREGHRRPGGFERVEAKIRS
jgi:transcriptional regulator with XRE-family HTH domain